MKTHLTRTIHSLDGNMIATAGFTDNRNGDVWTWISETVAAECECDPDDVHVLETDDGDVLTVEGMPVFKLC